MTTGVNYLDPQVLVRLEGLELKARAIVEGHLAGSHRSPHRGFSAEFAEHREYVHGDDLRYIDWKVYGKRDRYYLKQFEEETNFVCQILLDVSGSMSYASSGVALSKLEYAKCSVAALACLILRHRDSVGLTLFDDRLRNELRASSQPSHLKQIVHVLEQSGPASPVEAANRGTNENAADEDAGVPAEPLHLLADRLPSRGLVLIFSDFFGAVEPLLGALKHFRHRRHDVSLFQVVDPAEIEFPFEDSTLFRGLESTRTQFVEPRSLRKAYREEFERHRRLLEAGAHNLQCDFTLLRTDAPLDRALSQYLLRRTRRLG